MYLRNIMQFKIRLKIIIINVIYYNITQRHMSNATFFCRNRYMTRTSICLRL